MVFQKIYTSKHQKCVVPKTFEIILGRLEHNQGIMHIPEIVKELDKLGVDYN